MANASVQATVEIVVKVNTSLWTAIKFRILGKRATEILQKGIADALCIEMNAKRTDSPS